MSMPTNKLLLILPLIMASTAVLMAQPARRPLKLDDVPRLREVRDPQISPDGQWVAYAVSTVDVKEDKADSQVWVVSFDGKTERQMTRGPESASSPLSTGTGAAGASTSSDEMAGAWGSVLTAFGRTASVSGSGYPTPFHSAVLASDTIDGSCRPAPAPLSGRGCSARAVPVSLRPNCGH